MDGNTENKTNEIKRKAALRKIIFVMIAVVGFIFILEVFLSVSGVSRNSNPAKLDTRAQIADFVQSLEWDMNVEKSNGGSLYIEDPELLWKLRPGFEGWARDFFIMTVTDHAPRWHFRINERGFRDPSFEDRPQPGTYRVLCFGDSCIFGFGVDDEDTLPARLKAELDSMCPAGRFEVINMGIPGYSSRQGLELAKYWIPRLSPDIVMIAYGTNDWWHRELSDDEAMKEAQTCRAALSRFLGRFAVVKFISSLSDVAKAREKENTILPSRVSKPEFETNVASIAELASQNGAKVMLVDMNLYVPYGAEALISISKRRPDYFYIDGVEVLADNLKDIGLLRSSYPVDSGLAEKIYGAEIKRRHIFYVMVDPVHPNALGHRLLAKRCAAVIFNPAVNSQLTALMTRTIESMPPVKAMGAQMISPTALEERLTGMAENK